MAPASGPVQDPKMFPAATMEDQEDAVQGNQPPIVLGAAPFSSPDPETDAIKMLPLEEGTSAYEAKQEGMEAAQSEADKDYDSMAAADLKSLVEERDLGEIEGTGAKGKVTKNDMVTALKADDTKGMKASDWKDRISAASTQEELDDVLTEYEESDADYSSVEAAAEKRQEELDEAATSPETDETNDGS